jgi:hypothetical protein
MIKETANEEILNSLRDNVLIHLEKALDRKILLGTIDGAKLNDDPYNRVCEIEFSSKYEMDKLLASPEGKSFNRNLTSYFQHISIFFIDYGE